MLCHKLFTNRNKSILLVRFKHKPDHWSEIRKKVHAKDKALEHFDDFYKQVFNKKWPDIRGGLLGKQKYVAVVNNYSDTDDTIKNLENAGAVNLRKLFELERGYILEETGKNKRLSHLMKVWKSDVDDDKSDKPVNVVKKVNIQSDNNHELSLAKSLKTAQYDMERFIDTNNTLASEMLYQFIPTSKIKGKEDYMAESEHYDYYDNSTNIGVKIQREFDLNFPEHLNIYAFESDTDFDSPKTGSTGVLNYYLMDGASILPVLALDLKPRQRVLDMCASPGGKSLLAVQSLYPKVVVCNDVSKSRVDRIFKVYKQYLFDFKEKFLDTEHIQIWSRDARFIDDKDFDRILVDVPCTTDRHSLKENDNNIFKPSRIKERLKLPEIQCELLVRALQLVKKGGVVVYSTCSLSPIQNDGVVHMALKKINQETDSEIVVRDLTPALLQIRSLYKLAPSKLLKYGHLVIPVLSDNFGPTYFCKLEKIK